MRLTETLPAPIRAGLASLRQRPRFIDAAILLVATLVRFWRLSYHSIWFDEAVSLKWAGADMSYTWRVTFQLVQDKHPPVYYISLHLWQELLDWFGLAQNDAALRAWGAFLGVLTVWGILRLAASTDRYAVGWVAGLLVALSPLLTWYSQELRMFQPAATGIVWFAFALYAAWHSDFLWRRIAWWLLAIVAIEATLYTYLFSAFVLPAAGFTLLLLAVSEHRWRRFMEGAAALAIIGVLYLPLAANAWRVNAAESTPGQAFADFLPNLYRLLSVYTLWRVDWPPWIQTGGVALFGLLIILGLLLPRRSQSDGSAPRAADHSRLWLWLWIGIPLLIANILQARSHSIFREDRYLLFLVPFVLWAAARGVLILGERRHSLGWTSGAGAVLLLCIALPTLWTPAHYREQWRAAADYIATYQKHSPGLPASVVTHVDYTHQALEWYVRQRAGFETLPVFFPFGGTLTPDDVDEVVAPPLQGIVDFGSHTLWLTQSHLEGVDDQRVVEGWLTQNFPLITEQYPPGIKLTGYMLQARYDTLPPLADTARNFRRELQPGLRLLACEIVTPQVAAQNTTLHPPSGWVHVRLWWQAAEPLTQDYLATAQVIGAEGIWGDRLHRPTEALRMAPSSGWQSGEIVRDEVDINLNPLTPPGTYPVMIGAAPAGGQGTAGSQQVECGQVTVQENR